MQASEWHGVVGLRWAPGHLHLLTWATIALAAGAPAAHAQGSIPDIRGTYEGLGRLTSQKCPDLSGGDAAVIVTIPIQQGQSFIGSVGVQGETGAALLTGTTDASGQLGGCTRCWLIVPNQVILERTLIT